MPQKITIFLAILMYLLDLATEHYCRLEELDPPHEPESKYTTMFSTPDKQTNRTPSREEIFEAHYTWLTLDPTGLRRGAARFSVRGASVGDAVTAFPKASCCDPTLTSPFSLSCSRMK